MELGQRLKQARLEAGLSQRQLCGDTITRNMLSQIENGAARPSMDTLQYLAAQLGKSVSYFLEGSTASPNQDQMAAARAAFASGNFDAALEHLATYQTPDEIYDAEYHFLRCLILLKQAEAETDAMHARQLLESVKEAGKQTPYYGDELERRRLLCLAKIDAEHRAEILENLPGENKELLLRAKTALEAGNFATANLLLDAAPSEYSADWLLLRGDCAMAAGDMTAAENWYLKAEKNAPKPAYARLEALYKKQENYRLAYEYACKQRDE